MTLWNAKNVLLFACGGIRTRKELLGQLGKRAFVKRDFLVNTQTESLLIARCIRSY